MSEVNDTIDSAEPPVLVVVDMQIRFKASRDPETIDAVSAEIVSAIAESRPIIFVEYEGEGPTQNALLDLVEGYQFAVRVEKSTDGGGEEVFEACMDNGYWPENFRVCGVNADGCVHATVEGLVKKSSRINVDVVQNACHTDSGWRNWPRKFDGMRRVRLVNGNN